MVHCWDEYMWKVHKALPVDPWTSNVQLLDVLIHERNTSSPITWLPAAPAQPPSSGAAKPPPAYTRMSRAGSMFSLGIKDQSFKTEAATDGSAINNGSTGISTKRNSDSSNEPSLPVLASSMPDIQVSIRSSNSLLASIVGGGSTARAQFDVKDSRTVSCTVSGVKSRRVDTDALMELVSPASASSGHPIPWRPNKLLPQLQWPSKRGQTLWVVTEIIYASLIKIKADKDEQGGTKAQVSQMDITEQVGVEKETVWTVTAPKDNPIFPFAVRLQRLSYDVAGSLITTQNKECLKRSKSLKTKNGAAGGLTSFFTRLVRKQSSKHVDVLTRSSSVSCFLP